MLDLLSATTPSSAGAHQTSPQLTGDAEYAARQNVAILQKAGIRAYVAIPNYFDFRHTGLFGAQVVSATIPRTTTTSARPDNRPCVRITRSTTTGAGGIGRSPRSAATPADSKRGAPPASVDAYCVPSVRGGFLRQGARIPRDFLAYEKALRKRRMRVEPSLAEAEGWHGMRRFRLRRLEKANVEALLIASGRNAKRSLAFGGRRPKKLAQAAALGLPKAPLSYSGCAIYPKGPPKHPSM